MRILFLFLAISCALIFLAGCSLEAKKASEYKGNGKLQYLKAPLLGINGWRLELPHFDMSKGIDATYNLTGLPDGNTYMIYLTVPTNLPLEVEQGTFSFRLMRDGNVLRELPPTKISRMVNTTTGSQNNNFYYYDKTSKDPYSVYAYAFDVTKKSGPLTFAISCRNPFLRQPLEAYVKVERGGYK